MAGAKREDAIGIDIIMTRHLFEPWAKDATWFGLEEATTRALERQPEATLSHGIDRVSVTAFNSTQVTRLLHEFRFLTQQSDDVRAGPGGRRGIHRAPDDRDRDRP